MGERPNSPIEDDGSLIVAVSVLILFALAVAAVWAIKGGCS